MNEKVFYSEYFYDNVSKDTSALEKNAKEYSLSSLASFLLLYHYKKIHHPDFEKQAKKTALLFNNPHWLQFQLHYDNNKELHENIIAKNVEEPNLLPEIINDVPAEISVEQNFMDESKNVSLEKNEDAPETNNEINETASQNIYETLPDQNIEKVNEEIISEENLSSRNHQQEKPSEVVTDNLQTEPIAFEPLHTVDYFASQGIKINEDLVANDKLGNQMKSFTQWLKSMKKLHPSKLEEHVVVNEKLIQNAAEESNINTEILTEAMAEVLIKQNKREKAIEMFSKLSLINPAKSAYFAARIESIKSN